MEPDSSQRTCPRCGQLLPLSAEACAQCGRDEANPFTSPATPIAPPIEHLGPNAFGAAVAVIGCSVVIGIMVPGLGVLLGLVLVPASIRAAAAMRRQAATAATSAKPIGYLQALLTSAGVMFLVWLASTIAFTIICFPLGLLSFDIHSGGGVGLAAGLMLGALAGLAVFFWLTHRYWPRAARNEDATA